MRKKKLPEGVRYYKRSNRIQTRTAIHYTLDEVTTVCRNALMLGTMDLSKVTCGHCKQNLAKWRKEDDRSWRGRQVWINTSGIYEPATIIDYGWLPVYGLNGHTVQLADGTQRYIFNTKYIEGYECT